MSSTKAITRFQAIFRGRRCREMHVDRVRKGLRKLFVCVLLSLADVLLHPILTW